MAVVGEVPQLAKLRLEEEESWISSEELHTEGSTDDEAPTACSPYTLPPHRILAKSATTGGSPRVLKPHPSMPKSPITRSRSDGAPPLGPIPTSDDTEEQEDIMLWRPKRGSLKLPQFHLDAESSNKMPDTTKIHVHGKDKKPDTARGPSPRRCQIPDSTRGTSVPGSGRVPSAGSSAPADSAVLRGPGVDIPCNKTKIEQTKQTATPKPDKTNEVADST